MLGGNRDADQTATAVTDQMGLFHSQRVEKLHHMFDISRMFEIARRRVGLAEANDIRREQSKLPSQRFHIFAKLQPSSGAWVGGMQHQNVLAYADFPIVSAIFTGLNEFLLTSHVLSLLDHSPVGTHNQLSAWKQRIRLRRLRLQRMQPRNHFFAEQTDIVQYQFLGHRAHTDYRHECAKAAVLSVLRHEILIDSVGCPHQNKAVGAHFFHRRDIVWIWRLDRVEGQFRIHIEDSLNRSVVNFSQELVEVILEVRFAKLLRFFLALRNKDMTRD